MFITKVQILWNNKIKRANKSKINTYSTRAKHQMSV